MCLCRKTLRLELKLLFPTCIFSVSLKTSGIICYTFTVLWRRICVIIDRTLNWNSIVPCGSCSVVSSTIFLDASVLLCPMSLLRSSLDTIQCNICRLYLRSNTRNKTYHFDIFPFLNALIWYCIYNLEHNRWLTLMFIVKTVTLY